MGTETQYVSVRVRVSGTIVVYDRCTVRVTGTVSQTV
jgi:hypothetical protein